MKKIIALDIDGTLYNDKKRITEDTLKCLIECEKDGNILVLASGRPTPGLVKIGKQLEMDKYHGIYLAYNGGKLTDAETGEVLYQNAIPNAKAKEILNYLKEFPTLPVVDDGKNIYTNKPLHPVILYESKGNNLPVKEVEVIADSVDFDPCKILICAEQSFIENFQYKIKAKFGKEFNFKRSAPIYLECTPKDVDKVEALDIVIKKFGKTRMDVIAFGDAENDLTMIKYAGCGVAMGNADDKTKEAASFVTLDNNHDGIAYALEKVGVYKKKEE